MITMAKTTYERVVFVCFSREDAPEEQSALQNCASDSVFLYKWPKLCEAVGVSPPYKNKYGLKTSKQFGLQIAPATNSLWR